ncbi:hypothetical protein BDZ89DRAFT_1046811 [Hymenopellis radicata]|nr:hypothetical protein BDZ89DRAFT_1046811 [Hymenopellis radicata]
MPRPLPPTWLKNVIVLGTIRVALPYLKEKLRRRSSGASAASLDAPIDGDNATSRLIAVHKGISSYDVLAVTALGFRLGSSTPFPIHDPAAHTTAYARALCGLFTALRRPSSQTSPASLDSSNDSTRRIAGEKGISSCALLGINAFQLRPGSCPPLPTHDPAAHTSAYTRSLCGLCATGGAAKKNLEIGIKPYLIYGSPYRSWSIKSSSASLPLTQDVLPDLFIAIICSRPEIVALKVFILHIAIFFVRNLTVINPNSWSRVFMSHFVEGLILEADALLEKMEATRKTASNDIKLMEDGG